MPWKTRFSIRADERRRSMPTPFALLPVAMLLFQKPHPSETFPEEVERTIETIVSERAKLQRGIFRAKGQVVQGYDEQARRLPTNVYCVFDTPGKRWRFERRGQMLRDIRTSTQFTPEVAEKIRSGTLESRARPRDTVAIQVRSPAYMTEWSAVGHPDEPNSASINIELRPPEHRTTVWDLLLFHPSTVGLLEPSEFRRGGRSIREIMQWFRQRTPHVTLEVQPDDTLALVFRSERLRRTIWIDPAQGFTVRRMLLVVFGDDGEPMQLPRMESTADWELKQGVWVPIHFVTSYFHENGTVDAHEYELTWEAINPPAESLDPKLFTYQSFEGVWDYTRVFDRRGEETLYVETIGAPPEKFLGMKRAGSPPPAPTPEEPTSWVLWLIMVNLVAAALIAVYFCWKRLRAGA